MKPTKPQLMLAERLWGLAGLGQGDPLQLGRATAVPRVRGLNQRQGQNDLSSASCLLQTPHEPLRLRWSLRSGFAY